MIVVQRSTDWNWNIGVLNFFFEITNHRFYKIDFIDQICIENTPHPDYISYHSVNHADRCLIENTKIDNKVDRSPDPQIRFRRKWINLIVVHRSTYWNWNIGVLNFFEITNHRFYKIDFIDQICIENTPHPDYISYHSMDHENRCRIENTKTDK